MHFLWRMFALFLIYMLSFMLLFWIFSRLAHRYIGSGASHAVFWFNVLYPVFVNSILIKLMLLLPALIIVLDCTIFDSFKLFRRYKLSNAKELVFLYFANIAIGLSRSILSFYFLDTTHYGTTVLSQYISRTIFFLITSFINLMIAIMAVRFVASQNLVYDVKLVEDSPKYVNGN